MLNVGDVDIDKVTLSRATTGKYLVRLELKPYEEIEELFLDKEELIGMLYLIEEAEEDLDNESR